MLLGSAVAAGAMLAILPLAASARGLALGFNNDPALATGNPSWIARARAEDRTAVIRVGITWRDVAPARRPKGFHASNPASAGYDWNAPDAAVRNLRAAGFQLLITVWGAPSWAEGRNRAPLAPAGTWRPDPRQLGAFATAAARRYGGRFPDPLHPGHKLPRVTKWQGWNEPNLITYLTPQWTRTRRGFAAASPLIYRRLLNAFYGAVKSVSRSNFVSAAGTSPYGDPRGGNRMHPVAFYRALFCLQGAAKLRPERCRDPAHLDALDHHPYAVGGPLQKAYNRDDATVPDLWKIARVLRAAERARHVLPRGRKRLWATEMSWDSAPPDPGGVPIWTHARWVEQMLHVLWRQGVDTILWLQLADAPPIPNYHSTYQGGLYYLNGAAKPAATTFRFPFIANRLKHSRVSVWSRIPASGSVQIQLRHGSAWRTLRTIRARRDAVIIATLSLRGRAVLRGVAGHEASLPWTVHG